MLNNIIFAFLTWHISFGTQHIRTLCNGRYETLGCEPNFIYITDVFYGRDTSLICQPGSHSYCSSNKTENIIRHKCDGKSVCYVSVYPGVLQDSNCRYANPYLRIHYKCGKSEVFVTTSSASDGNTSKTDATSINVAVTGHINTTGDGMVDGMVDGIVDGVVDGMVDGMTMQGIKGETSETNSISIYFKISMVSCGAVFIILIAIAVFLFVPCRKRKQAKKKESKMAEKDLWI
ncbi:Hypothetical predicted protein [Mytilus galloprovincialis]|uniref:SUEL-type lectin domain-containing protein n=1 Tax=Mytilus galloprovincialis TaxID=29158 RepID=A0A8B6E6I7_MYTGA|nr:Hypothetical predicted protein [Mytilus galloprovincialis]